MATLTIKNLPDDLYARLKERAERHRRSLNGEAITCLEAALGESARADPDDLLAGLRRARAGVRNVFLTDAALKSARSAGRR